MKNLKSLFVAGMIGAGSLGIFGNARGQEKQDTCKRHSLEEFSINLSSSEEGKLIFSDTNTQGTHIAYFEDVPYISCRGKKALANMLLIDNKGEYLILMDTYNKTNLSEKGANLNDKIEYVIEGNKLSKNARVISEKWEKYTPDSKTNILNYENDRYYNYRKMIEMSDISPK